MKILHGKSSRFAECGSTANVNVTRIGAYEIPSTIGVGAERVLQGCLDKDVATRWSIDLVDDAAWGIGDSETEDEETNKHDLEHHHAHHVSNCDTGAATRNRTRSRSSPTSPNSGSTKSESRSRTRPYPSYETLAKVHPDAHPWVSTHAKANSIDELETRSADDNPDATAAFLQRGRRAKRDIGAANRTANVAMGMVDTSLERNHQLDQPQQVVPRSQNPVWSPSPGPSVVSASHSSSTADGLTHSHSRSRSRSVPPRTPRSPLDASMVFGFTAGRQSAYAYDAEDEELREDVSMDKDGQGEVDQQKAWRRMSSRSRVRNVRYEEVIDEGEDLDETETYKEDVLGMA